MFFFSSPLCLQLLEVHLEHVGLRSHLHAATPTPFGDVDEVHVDDQRDNVVQKEQLELGRWQ
jgi:hypothetical protein